jgi:ATP-dependent Clp protease protease subunit
MKHIQIPSGFSPSPQGQRFFARSAEARFEAKSTGQITQIDLFDEIGEFGVSASAFRDQLRNAGRNDVVLRINSPGGNVFDGVSIFNMLTQHPGDVRVEILGLAASAASIIAMAGTSIAVAANSFIMIHRSWAMTVGNSADHGDTQRLLDQIDGAMAQTYSDRSGQSLAAINQAMSAETWFQGQDAIDAGLADELIGAANAHARFDLSAFAHAPTDLQAAGSTAAPDIASPFALEKLLRSVGLSRSQAAKVAVGGWDGLSAPKQHPTPTVNIEIATLQQRVALATAQIKGI